MASWTLGGAEVVIIATSSSELVRQDVDASDGVGGGIAEMDIGAVDLVYTRVFEGDGITGVGGGVGRTPCVGVFFQACVDAMMGCGRNKTIRLHDV